MLGSASWMLDVVAAPKISQEGAEILLRRKSRKVMVNPALKDLAKAALPPGRRKIRGGELCQPPHDFTLDLSGNDDFSDTAKLDLIIAWAAAFFSFHGGNEVALARGGRLVSVGGGPSTVHAAKTAVERGLSAARSLEGSSFAVDAFFPFTDAPIQLVEAGCRHGVAPMGGLRFKDVANFFTEHNVKVHYLPETIRGFIRH
jgi:AICAR transformylase/IMP cyclohydrolase PurH